MEAQNEVDAGEMEEHSVDTVLRTANRCGVERALCELLGYLDAEKLLHADRLAEGRRVLKRVAHWNTLGLPRRASLWWRVERLAEDTEVLPVDLRRLALRPSTAPAAPPQMTRATDELDGEALAFQADRRRLINRLDEGTPIRDLVAEFAAERSRAWVYRTIQHYRVRGSVADARTAYRVRPPKIEPAVRYLLEAYQARRKARPTIANVCLRLATACGRLGLTVPSESWVRARIDEDPQLKLRLSHGRAIQHRQHRAIMSRDAGVAPGQIYEVDSTKLDVWIRRKNRSGNLEVVRPEMTLVIDVASRAVVGFHLSMVPVNEQCVQKALLHAMTDGEDLPGFFGKPAGVRFDRGGEYTADLRHKLGAIGVDVQRGRPHTPDERAKVERALGTINKWLSEMPGYIPAVGGKPRLAQKHLSELWEEPTLRHWILLRLRHLNDAVLHRGLGATRRMAWETAARPVALTDTEVRTLLPESREVTISHGIITLQHALRRHVFAADFLADHAGRQVEVRYQSLHDRMIHVYDTQTRLYLGSATAMNAETTDADIQRIQRANRELRERVAELLMPAVDAETLRARASGELPGPAKPVPLIVSIEENEDSGTEEVVTRSVRVAEGSAPPDPEVQKLQARRAQRAS